MNKTYLIDVNLPKYFSFFNDPMFIHVVDINPCMSDKDVWNYALENRLIILTKDVDFYNRFMTESQYPKIIYFQLVNLKLNDLHNYFEKHWNYILKLVESNSMIIACQTEIQVIK